MHRYGIQQELMFFFYYSFSERDKTKQTLKHLEPRTKTFFREKDKVSKVDFRETVKLHFNKIFHGILIYSCQMLWHPLVKLPRSQQMITY